MQPVSSTISLFGILQDVNGDPINKKKINLYHGNQELLANFKTKEAGKFEVQISKSIDFEKIELLFRLCGQNKISSKHYHKNTDQMTKCTLLKIPHEKEEVVCPVILNAQNIYLGKVRMETAFDHEKVPLSYQLDILKSTVPAFATGAYASAKTSLFFEEGEKTIEEIQKIYNIKSIPLTDKNVWNLLTNGICPGYFKVEKESRILSMEFNWNLYSFDKEGLPNTKIYFSNWEGAHAAPKIEKIEVQYRKGLHPPKSANDMDPLTTHFPTDPNFDDIKRKLNNGALIFGQTVFHLGWGHIYGSRIAQLVHDYLPGTRLGNLLLPHCRFIRKITNDLGKSAIEGVNGILDRSPLNPDGILQALSTGIGTLNPFTSQPRIPLNDDHTFARDQQIFYAALKSAVDKILDEEWGVISTTDWCKVSAFFSKVHSGSPFFHEWGSEIDSQNDWLDSREIGGIKTDIDPPRTKSNPFDPEVRSIPLIADDPKGPKENDRKLIAKFIVDFLNRVIFWHSSVHESQYKESPHFPNSKDVNFTPISLGGKGDKPFGGIAKDDAIEQQEIGKTFEDFPVKEYALIDPRLGVHPKIVKAIVKIAPQLSIPLDEIMVSTVI